MREERVNSDSLMRFSSCNPYPGRRPKINVLAADLSGNAVHRCLRIAQALSPHYDVDLVGTTFGVGRDWGRGVWPPMQGLPERLGIELRSVVGDHWPFYASSVKRLLGMLDGDVIIACKPRMASFGVALIKRTLSGVPVILDVDDDELAMTLPGGRFSWWRRLREVDAYNGTRLVHRFRGRADGIFCVSEYFRSIYGGVIVPHGRDPCELDPQAYDRSALRADLGIAEHECVIGFIGTPRRAKGLDLIAQAMVSIGDPRLRLLVVGAAPGDSYINELAGRLGKTLIVRPPQPLDASTAFLAATDVVVLPQRDEPVSRGQMPAKLTDSMAMAKLVIASRLADIPRLLDGCGLVIPPDDEEALAGRLREILARPEMVRDLGERARSRFLSDLTLDAMARVMIPVIEQAHGRQAKISPERSCED